MMMEWWNALSMLQQVMYCIAIPATVILLLQIVLLLFGIGDHGDSDAPDGGVDTDGDGTPDGYDHDMDHDAVHDGLHLLTVRGIVAFLAIGAWIGLALMDAGSPTWLSMIVALAAGLLALVGVAWLMKMAFRLQQSGNLSLGNAVGLSGEVYVPVGPLPQGKVTLILQERFVELPAICREKELPTGTQVTVTEVVGGQTLVVQEK